MNLPRQFAFVSALVITSAIPALAGVTISSPGNGADVQTPFTLSATAIECSAHPVTAIGYSLDNSGDTTIIRDQNVDAKVAAPIGNHVLHVKAWAKSRVCVTDVAIHVTPSTSLFPADAVSVGNIEALSNWELQHDPATNGKSSGAMNLVDTPAHTGAAREFVTQFTNGGGQLFHVSFGDDTEATNFLYDTWVYLDSSASHIANLEMDMNQVMENGETVIFGFQCDGYSGTWDYSENAGTPERPSGRWVHSKAACNVRNWTINEWHHVQISYSRNDAGMVTYKSVWLDGREQAINGTGLGARALGWGPVLLTNLQVDGLGTGGTATVYVNDLTVYRW
ncbi:MAG TPA: hypothetical protein VFE06_12670 [Acidobacteriaceae bacterium]|nr:hypothetical protein [Acidobacteriaceae bacterium]